ncbi:rCG22936 [Rattus norvegicus]|uniref:RCG22936 n=1 Tax=Rattus norvegicus TaxID=10116 RepID=A6KB17_RAT|nr:rCG22936 [Rattus norvegicus]
MLYCLSCLCPLSLCQKDNCTAPGIKASVEAQGSSIQVKASTGSGASVSYALMLVAKRRGVW